MIFSEIDDYARQNRPLPPEEEASAEDWSVWAELCQIYGLYRARKITAQEGETAKKQIIRAYDEKVRERESTRKLYANMQERIIATARYIADYRKNQNESTIKALVEAFTGIGVE